MVCAHRWAFLPDSATLPFNYCFCPRVLSFGSVIISFSSLSRVLVIQTCFKRHWAMRWRKRIAFVWRHAACTGSLRGVSVWALKCAYNFQAVQMSMQAAHHFLWCLLRNIHLLTSSESASCIRSCCVTRYVTSLACFVRGPWWLDVSSDMRQSSRDISCRSGLRPCRSGGRCIAG